MPCILEDFGIAQFLRQMLKACLACSGSSQGPELFVHFLRQLVF